MGFYLDGEYVNDEYYRTLLKDNETTVTTSSDLTSLEETESANEFISSLLEKLGTDIESYSTSEILDYFIECLGDDELELQMLPLQLNKEYFQAILYLVKEGKITQADLQSILYSRSYQTRKEQIFSFLTDGEEDGSIDLFAPLKTYAKQLTNYQNQTEFSETEISSIPTNLKSIYINDCSMYLNIGNWYYANKTSSTSLFKYCGSFSSSSFSSLSNSNLKTLLSASTFKESYLDPFKISVALRSLKNTLITIFYSLLKNKYMTLSSGRTITYATYMTESQRLCGLASYFSQNDVFGEFCVRRLVLDVNKIFNDTVDYLSSYYINYLFNNRQSTSTIKSFSSYCSSQIDTVFKKCFAAEFDDAAAELMSYASSGKVCGYTTTYTKSSYDLTSFDLSTSNCFLNTVISKTSGCSLPTNLTSFLSTFTSTSSTYSTNPSLELLKKCVKEQTNTYTGLSTSAIEKFLRFNLLMEESTVNGTSYGKVINFGTTSLYKVMTEVCTTVQSLSNYQNITATQLASLNNCYKESDVYKSSIVKDYIDVLEGLTSDDFSFTETECVLFEFAKQIMLSYLEYLNDVSASDISDSLLIDHDFYKFYEACFFIRQFFGNLKTIINSVSSSSAFSKLQTDICGNSALYTGLYNYYKNREDNPTWTSYRSSYVTLSTSVIASALKSVWKWLTNMNMTYFDYDTISEMAVQFIRSSGSGGII